MEDREDPELEVKETFLSDDMDRGLALEPSHQYAQRALTPDTHDALFISALGLSPKTL